MSEHYGRSNLWNHITKGLQAAGKDQNQLTVADLAPIDHFHTRGREATLELAQMSGLGGKADLLDAMRAPKR